MFLGLEKIPSFHLDSGLEKFQDSSFKYSFLAKHRGKCGARCHSSNVPLHLGSGTWRDSEPPSLHRPRDLRSSDGSRFTPFDGRRFVHSDGSWFAFLNGLIFASSNASRLDPFDGPKFAPFLVQFIGLTPKLCIEGKREEFFQVSGPT